MSPRVGGRHGRVLASTCNVAGLSVKNQDVDCMAGHMRRTSRICTQDQLFDIKMYNLSKLSTVQEQEFLDSII